jgi:hypothetical protein
MALRQFVLVPQLPVALPALLAEELLQLVLVQPAELPARVVQLPAEALQALHLPASDRLLPQLADPQYPTLEWLLLAQPICKPPSPRQ